MIGEPKVLNSKADYEYVHTNFPETVWRPFWQALIAEKDKWIMTGKLAAKSPGVTDKTHKIVENDVDDGDAERYQYEYKQDPNCKLLRIGFSVKKVEAELL